MVSKPTASAVRAIARYSGQRTSRSTSGSWIPTRRSLTTGSVAAGGCRRRRALRAGIEQVFQALRHLWARAFILVFEVGEDVGPLIQGRPDPAGPLPEFLVRVLGLAQPQVSGRDPGQISRLGVLVV